MVSVPFPGVPGPLGHLFTWLVTAAGAAGVFFFRTVNRKLLDGMLGFAAGVMIAASYLVAAGAGDRHDREAGGIPWLPPTIGFLAGGAFLWTIDKTPSPSSSRLPA